MVHSGSVVGGHYYAFIRPHAGDGSSSPTEGKWYCFDDSTVREATKQEAVDENFGGCTDDEDKFWLNSAKSGVSTSAYMLVYIRESRVGEVLTASTDVPAKLERNIQRFDTDLAKSQSAIQAAQMCFTFHITRDADLVAHNRAMRHLHPDLKHRFWMSRNPLEVRKAATWKEFLKALNEHLGRGDGSKLRVMLWQWRANETERLFGPITTHNAAAHSSPCSKLSDSTILTDIFTGSDYVDESGKEVSEIFDAIWTAPSDAAQQRASGQVSTASLKSSGDALASDPYGPTDSNGSSSMTDSGGQETAKQMRESFFATENLSSHVFLHVEEAKPLKSDDVHLSVKLCDTARPLLTYQGSVTLNKSKKVSDLLKEIHSLIGRPPAGHSTLLWEERRANLVVPLTKTSATLASCELETGDIVICQHSPQGSTMRNDPAIIFSEVVMRKEVTLMEVNNERSPMTAVLGSDSTYSQCVSAIARAASIKPSHIRLHTFTGVVREEVNPSRSLQQLVSHDNILRYEMLRQPVVEMAQWLEISFAHYEPEEEKSCRVADGCLLLRRGCAVSDLLNSVASKANAVPSRESIIAQPVADLLAMRIHNSRITHLLRPTDALRPHASSPDISFRTELKSSLLGAAPNGSTGSDTPSHLVAVCHFERMWPGSAILSLHSSPFLASLCEGDGDGEFVTRCAASMGISKHARLAGWKLYLIHVTSGREECLGEIIGNVTAEVQRLLTDASCSESLEIDTESTEAVTLLLGIERRNDNRRVAADRGVKLNM
eukprot:TRINITY_DN1124_c0_g2_i3.p1 TRINITY_DN1124_c0_g2~~TRINITY_DN1124_c0_g2_i3.p1  ORF type:complete len:843 (+),score=256.25 TRINITY_DN1124_c0_g2_i3:208-2529(+)